MFLGACHAYTVEGTPPATTLSLVGLSHVLPAFIYPRPLAGLYLVFAIYDSAELSTSVVRVMSPAGQVVLRVDVRATDNLPPIGDPFFNRGVQLISVEAPDSVLVLEPGVYPVVLGDEAEARRIGDIVFAQVDVPPLSSEQIEALRLNPRALSGLQLMFACNTCGDDIKVYSAVERVPAQEANGVLWYQDVPEAFACECGGTRFGLSSIRKNLHAFLGAEAKQLPFGMRALGALQREAELMSIAAELLALVDANAPEEDVHQFINSNRVLLHPFAPVRVWSKPAITTRYRADFAIYTSSRELLLVELERPSTSLLKKNGGMTAELQKPLDQVRNWLAAVADHRATVLADLGLSSDRVTTVRALIIAGRMTREDPAALRVLALGRASTDVPIMTYDDLLVAMGTLIQSLAKTESGVKGQLDGLGETLVGSPGS